MIHLLPNFISDGHVRCKFSFPIPNTSIIRVICSVSQFNDCRQPLVVALLVFVVIFKTLSGVLIQRSNTNIFLQKAVPEFSYQQVKSLTEE